jgi:hypothetical protein
MAPKNGRSVQSDRVNSRPSASWGIEVFRLPNLLCHSVFRVTIMGACEWADQRAELGKEDELEAKAKAKRKVNSRT